MKQMLNYRTVLLAQAGTCSGILPMALRSTPHQSLASSIRVSIMSSQVTVRTYPNQKPCITGNIRTELINKQRALGLNISLCNWILDFLTGFPQVVRVGNNTSFTRILNTGAPQGCMLSPLLYSLFMHDWKGGPSTPPSTGL